MRELIDALSRWDAAGEAVATATVIDTKRSAPQPPGAKLALSASGDIAGAPPQRLAYGIADDEAWDVGLPCGGEIDVWVERYEP